MACRTLFGLWRLRRTADRRSPGALCAFQRVSPPLSSILGTAIVAAPLERLPCFLTIVEVNRAVPENLVVLMALARQQHDVPRLGFFNCRMNGFPPVRFNQVLPTGLLHAHHDVADDLQGVLLARIVARQNR